MRICKTGVQVLLLRLGLGHILVGSDVDPVGTKVAIHVFVEGGYGKCRVTLADGLRLLGAQLVVVVVMLLAGGLEERHAAPHGVDEVVVVGTHGVEEARAEEDVTAHEVDARHLGGLAAENRVVEAGPQQGQTAVD